MKSKFVVLHMYDCYQIHGLVSSCIIVLIVCKMFVVLQNLNTDLPKRFKCLIYDKFNTIRAVRLLFQICAADVLIFEPLSWLCGTNRTLLSEQHKYHGEFTRH